MYGHTHTHGCVFSMLMADRILTALIALFFLLNIPASALMVTSRTSDGSECLRLGRKEH